MKSRFIFAKSVSMVAAATVALTACSDFDYEQAYSTSAAQAFSASFVQQYGEIDPENDFNTAESNTAKVTINYSGTFTFAVYTADPYGDEELSYLLARYKDLAGDGATYEFNVDAPSMFNTLYAALTSDNGGTIVKTVTVADGSFGVVFGSADEVGTRAFSIDTSGKRWSVTKDSKQFTRDYLDAVLTYLPENIGTTSNNDYELVSNGPFTIYPIYSQTTGQDELGIYYYNPKTETQADAHIATVIPDIHNSSTWPEGTSYWRKNNMNDAAYYNIDVKGLTINVPKGYRVGMYLKNRAYGADGYISQTESMANANTFFSAQALNLGESYSAYYKSPTFFLLGLEDWKRAAGGDNDCNDFVFSVIAQSEEEIPDVVRLDTITTTRTETHTESITRNTAMGYVIAFEDLGSTDDSDFNDIVLRLNHVSGEEDATVELLAAGGTMETYILYGDEVLWDGKEVHKLYGVEQSKMVNTGWYSASNPDPTTIKVGADFKIKNAAKDFHIRVTAKDGSGVQTTVNVPYTKGVVPQALLIADPNWEWPEERVNIGTKYNQFSTFVSNYRDGLSWYNVTWAGYGNNTSTIGEETTVTYDTTYTITITETSYSAVTEGGVAGQTVSLLSGVNGLFAYRQSDATGESYTFNYEVPDGYQVVWANLEIQQSQKEQLTITSSNSTETIYSSAKLKVEQLMRDYQTKWATDYFGMFNGTFTITTKYAKTLQNVILNVKLKKINGTYPGETRTVANEGEVDLTEYRKAVTLGDGKVGYQFKYACKPGWRITSADIEVEFEDGTTKTEKNFYKRDDYTGYAVQSLYGDNNKIAWSSDNFKNGFTVGFPYLERITEVKSVKLTNVVLEDMRKQWALDFYTLANTDGVTESTKTSFTIDRVGYSTKVYNGVEYNFGVQGNLSLRKEQNGLYNHDSGDRHFAFRKVYAGQYIYVQSYQVGSITYSNATLSEQTKFSNSSSYLKVYKIEEVSDETVVFVLPRGGLILYVAVVNEPFEM